jgi:multicomponent Na+:H+ antiporter subunit B
VSPRLRLGVFGIGIAGLGALLVWAATGLPDFGVQTSAYGAMLNHAAVAERHTSNVVAAIVFDYRGLDTLGEELIVLASAFGVALLLREAREEDVGRPRDEVESEAIRAFGLGVVDIVFLVGLYVLIHGYVTPGGGFQGGVVLAAALALVYVAGGYRSYKRLAPTKVVDAVEGAGAGAFALVGTAALALGLAFLTNLLTGSLGVPRTLTSGGSIGILNTSAGVAVAAAFVLLFNEFLEELEAKRRSIE